MTCPSLRRNIVTASAFVAFAAVVLAQQTVSAQSLRTTHVVDGIYLITGAGGNVTVSAGSSGVLIVDSGSCRKVTREQNHQLFRLYL